MDRPGWSWEAIATEPSRGANEHVRPLRQRATRIAALRNPARDRWSEDRQAGAKKRGASEHEQRTRERPEPYHSALLRTATSPMS